MEEKVYENLEVRPGQMSMIDAVVMVAFGREGVEIKGRISGRTVFLTGVQNFEFHELKFEVDKMLREDRSDPRYRTIKLTLEACLQEVKRNEQGQEGEVVEERVRRAAKEFTRAFGNCKMDTYIQKRSNKGYKELSSSQNLLYMMLMDEILACNAVEDAFADNAVDGGNHVGLSILKQGFQTWLSDGLIHLRRIDGNKSINLRMPISIFVHLQITIEKLIRADDIIVLSTFNQSTRSLLASAFGRTVISSREMALVEWTRQNVINIDLSAVTWRVGDSLADEVYLLFYTIFVRPLPATSVNPATSYAPNADRNLGRAWSSVVSTPRAEQVINSEWNQRAALLPDQIKLETTRFSSCLAIICGTDQNDSVDETRLGVTALFTGMGTSVVELSAQFGLSPLGLTSIIVSFFPPLVVGPPGDLTVMPNIMNCAINVTSDITSYNGVTGMTRERQLQMTLVPSTTTREDLLTAPSLWLKLGRMDPSLAVKAVSTLQSFFQLRTNSSAEGLIVILARELRPAGINNPKFHPKVDFFVIKLIVATRTLPTDPLNTMIARIAEQASNKLNRVWIGFKELRASINCNQEHMTKVPPAVSATVKPHLQTEWGKLSLTTTPSSIIEACEAGAIADAGKVLAVVMLPVVTTIKKGTGSTLPMTEHTSSALIIHEEGSATQTNLRIQQLQSLCAAGYGIIKVVATKQLNNFEVEALSARSEAQARINAKLGPLNDININAAAKVTLRPIVAKSGFFVLPPVTGSHEVQPPPNSLHGTALSGTPSSNFVRSTYPGMQGQQSPQGATVGTPSDSFGRTTTCNPSARSKFIVSNKYETDDGQSSDDDFYERDHAGVASNSISTTASYSSNIVTADPTPSSAIISMQIALLKLQLELAEQQEKEKSLALVPMGQNASTATGFVTAHEWNLNQLRLTEGTVSAAANPSLTAGTPQDSPAGSYHMSQESCSSDGAESWQSSRSPEGNGNQLALRNKESFPPPFGMPTYTVGSSPIEHTGRRNVNNSKSTIMSTPNSPVRPTNNRRGLAGSIDSDSPNRKESKAETPPFYMSVSVQATAAVPPQPLHHRAGGSMSLLHHGNELRPTTPSSYAPSSSLSSSAAGTSAAATALTDAANIEPEPDPSAAQK